MDIQRIEDEILSIASIYEDSFERDVPTVWQVISLRFLSLCALGINRWAQKFDAPPAFHITVVPDDPDLQTLIRIRVSVTL